ncbi:hypothetical protein ECANGB1_672 [Enterospora canceri]|uniref:Uncharacterized protein n=1 Tax=Enterospora canceri TaxID=1081671 RepID=A0A1Y1S8H0_9MICR|nr:hypothetical protein ECANGB1_672 [Enterospora canceri]
MELDPCIRMIMSEITCSLTDYIETKTQTDFASSGYRINTNIQKPICKITRNKNVKIMGLKRFNLDMLSYKDFDILHFSDINGFYARRRNLCGTKINTLILNACTISLANLTYLIERCNIKGIEIHEGTGIIGNGFFNTDFINHGVKHLNITDLELVGANGKFNLFNHKTLNFDSDDFYLSYTVNGRFYKSFDCSTTTIMPGDMPRKDIFEKVSLMDVCDIEIIKEFSNAVLMKINDSVIHIEKLLNSIPESLEFLLIADSSFVSEGIQLRLFSTGQNINESNLDNLDYSKIEKSRIKEIVLINTAISSEMLNVFCKLQEYCEVYIE